jgi:hypothetical protein
MIQQSYIESNYGSQEDIDRGHTVQQAKENTGSEDAPFGLDDPSEEQFFSKACHDGDEADIDERARGKEGSYVTSDSRSQGTYDGDLLPLFRQRKDKEDERKCCSGSPDQAVAQEVFTEGE